MDYCILPRALRVHANEEVWRNTEILTNAADSELERKVVDTRDSERHSETVRGGDAF